jgi:hypothetical protein
LIPVHEGLLDLKPAFLHALSYGWGEGPAGTRNESAAWRPKIYGASLEKGLAAPEKEAEREIRKPNTATYG